MPTYQVVGPDGSKYRVQAPEGATEQQILDRVINQAGSARKGATGKLDAFMRGVADVPTLGLADKIAAAGNALIPLDRLTGNNVKSIWDGASLSDAYDANLKLERTKNRYDEKNNGGYRLAGQVIGAFLPIPGSQVLAGTRGGRAVNAASQKLAKRGIMGRAAVAGTRGAAEGAAYGFNTTDGAIGERAKGAAKGAALSGGFSAGGSALGSAIARAVGGKVAPKNVQTLANAGVVMTPGQRNGGVRRWFEDAVLGSIPVAKSVPAAAKQRGVDQLNVAAYNDVLDPIGAKLPMDTTPGPDAIQNVGDLAYGAYGDALSNLNLTKDPELAKAAEDIIANAVANVGKNNANQLTAKIAGIVGKLDNGPVSGDALRGVMQDVRGQASNFKKSLDVNQQGIGDQLWALHGELDNALARQNPPEAVPAYENAREAVARLKRVEDAAARGVNSRFNPTQLWQAVNRNGFGTTTASRARGEGRLYELANAAKDILPDTVPNSGTPERVAGMALLGGGTGGAAMIDPTLGALSATSLLGYVPGLDRAIQNFALNRPDGMKRAGTLLDRYLTPALGVAGIAGGMALSGQ